jgi:hypothetical protein
VYVVVAVVSFFLHIYILNRMAFMQIFYGIIERFMGIWSDFFVFSTIFTVKQTIPPCILYGRVFDSENNELNKKKL